ncbi:hypothetical protein GWK47_000936 [Chionoecetes opilio]|uniref:Uncharacterized protein n=1 Tax=Chionoecetes opilio TaxID=41210 RepID=A0A8J4XXG7_CHIOP|nr:hypothetical protein GWK47_000936 [Chionoecetes opilio]
MSSHMLRPRPRQTDPPFLKASRAYRDKEIGRASGKVMARPSGTLARSSSPLPLRRANGWSRGESGPSSAPCSSGWWREPACAAPTIALAQGSSAPWRRLRRPTLSGPSHRPRGRHDFLNVDPAEWSGRDRLHTARRRARHLRLVNDFAERGVARLSAFPGGCPPARRGTATAAPSAGRLERHRAVVARCAK